MLEDARQLVQTSEVGGVRSEIWSFAAHPVGSVLLLLLGAREAALDHYHIMRSRRGSWAESPVELIRSAWSETLCYEASCCHVLADDEEAGRYLRVSGRESDPEGENNVADLVADNARRRSSPRPNVPAASLPTLTTRDLVDRVDEVRGTFGPVYNTGPFFRTDEVYAEIVTRGFAAFDELVEHVRSDTRLSRTVNAKGMSRMRFWIVPAWIVAAAAACQMLGFDSYHVLLAGDHDVTGWEAADRLVRLRQVHEHFPPGVQALATLQSESASIDAWLDAAEVFCGDTLDTSPETRVRCPEFARSRSQPRP